MAQKTMRPVEEVIKGNIDYVPPVITAPKLSGFSLKLFNWLVEGWLGGFVLSRLLRVNGISQTLMDKTIPDDPMYFPEYPTEREDKEENVKVLHEGSESCSQVAVAVESLSPRPSLRSQPGYPCLYWSIRDYAEAYRTHSTTPTEIVERFISIIEQSLQTSPTMNYFISFDPADLRKQAAASTERISSGRSFSILDGVLIAVKDDIDCLPHPTTAGTKFLHEFREVKEDAICISRLRKCGVIFVGKTNMHELGMGTTGSNPHHGVMRNPHDTKRHTGGSSSGSTAVVAAGLCPAALGTDVGGSVRIPASLCGAVGLKPTFGRVTLKGAVPAGWTMESIGPIAANVEDVLLVYAAIAGAHETDVLYSKPFSPCIPLLQDDVELQSLKIGKYTDWFSHVSSPDVSQACSKSLELLNQTYGVSIEEIAIPELEELRIGHIATVGCEYALAGNTFYDYGRTKMAGDSRLNMSLFRYMKGSEYIAAQRLRRRSMYFYMEIFKSVDVIVTPTTGMTAPKISSTDESDLVTTGNLMRFVSTGNFLGLPCISVPVGHDENGLPIGLQLIGRPWEEATLLRLASAVERICSPLRKRPVVFHDMLMSGNVPK